MHLIDDFIILNGISSQRIPFLSEHDSYVSLTLKEGREKNTEKVIRDGRVGKRERERRMYMCMDDFPLKRAGKTFCFSGHFLFHPQREANGERGGGEKLLLQLNGVKGCHQWNKLHNKHSSNDN
jgi:hypothetical protein